MDATSLILKRVEDDFCSGLMRMCLQDGQRFERFERRGVRRGLRELWVGIERGC